MGLSKTLQRPNAHFKDSGFSRLRVIIDLYDSNEKSSGKIFIFA